MPRTTAAAVRIVTFERDATTDTRSVDDIREFATPSTPTPRTWTELSRDAGRRELLLSLVAQIDALAAGRIDEISLVASL